MFNWIKRKFGKKASAARVIRNNRPYERYSTPPVYTPDVSTPFSGNSFLLGAAVGAMADHVVESPTKDTFVSGGGGDFGGGGSSGSWDASPSSTDSSSNSSGCSYSDSSSSSYDSGSSSSFDSSSSCSVDTSSF